MGSKDHRSFIGANDVHAEMLDLATHHCRAMLESPQRCQKVCNVSVEVLALSLSAALEDDAQEKQSQVSFVGPMLEAVRKLDADQALSKECDSLRVHLQLFEDYILLANLHTRSFPGNQSAGSKRQWCQDQSKEVIAVNACLARCKSCLKISCLANLTSLATKLTSNVGETMRRACLEQWHTQLSKLTTAKDKAEAWKKSLPPKPTWEQVRKAGKAFTPGIAKDLKSTFNQTCKDESQTD